MNIEVKCFEKVLKDLNTEVSKIKEIVINNSSNDINLDEIGIELIITFGIGELEDAIYILAQPYLSDEYWNGEILYQANSYEDAYIKAQYYKNCLLEHFSDINICISDYSSEIKLASIDENGSVLPY